MTYNNFRWGLNSRFCLANSVWLKLEGGLIVESYGISNKTSMGLNICCTVIDWFHLSNLKILILTKVWKKFYIHLYLEVITDIYFVCMKCSFIAQLLEKVQREYLGINEHKLNIYKWYKKIFKLTMYFWSFNKAANENKLVKMY